MLKPLARHSSPKTEGTRCRELLAVTVMLIFRLLAPTPSTAAPISVENGSFEEPACPAYPGCISSPDGDFTVEAPPGWNLGGIGGVYRPTTFNPGFPTDGLQSGFANAGGSLTQTGIVRIADGVTYTLVLDVGSRLDNPLLDFTVSLLADGVSVASSDETDIAGGIPSPGDFGTITLSYVGTPATAGQCLDIELATLSNQANWDSLDLADSTTAGSPPCVAVSVTDIPTVGQYGLALLALLLAVSAGVAIRRQRA